MVIRVVVELVIDDLVVADAEGEVASLRCPTTITLSLCLGSTTLREARGFGACDSGTARSGGPSQRGTQGEVGLVPR